MGQWTWDRMQKCQDQLADCSDRLREAFEKNLLSD